MSDHTAVVVITLACAVVCAIGGAWYWLRVVKPLLPAPPARDITTDWHPLAGNRLELADTGFAIVLVVDARAPGHVYPYSLYTPEGKCVGSTPDLAAAKRHAEQLARDRAEFAAGYAALAAMYADVRYRSAMLKPPPRRP